MRRLFRSLLLSALLLAFAGCAAPPPGFPRGKRGPTETSTTTPSECLAKGKAAEGRDDWAMAYRWYARGGGWNVQGRSTGFPGPGRLDEPEESQRFLCIVGFLEATRHLIAQGIRVDADGVHPLYVSVSEASQAIAYFRNVNPHGYAGLSAAQIAALQQGAGEGATGRVRSGGTRNVTMDTVEQVDHTRSHLQTFQDTVSASSDRPDAEKHAAPGSPEAGTPFRDNLNMRQAPPITMPVEKRNTHAEAARVYRDAAAKYPEGDPRRQEMLNLAAEEERQAAHP